MKEEEKGDEDRFGMESEEDIQELPEPAEISEHVEEPGKVRLIMHRGSSIGKKIAITGVAISTAPIVLPRLLIFSAFGLAFSVPFGLVFAGYACTHKIMRSLLPPPLPNGIVASSPEEELHVKVLSEEMKQEEVSASGSEIEELEKVEDGEGGVGYEKHVEKREEVREIPEDNESRLGSTEPPKDDGGEGLKGQVGKKTMKEITKKDDRSRLVVGERREEEDVLEGDNKTGQDIGERRMEEVRGGDNKMKHDAMEEVRGGDNKMKHDAGVIKREEEKEMQGREVCVKEISEADDYGVPSVVVVSALKEETGEPKHTHLELMIQMWVQILVLWGN